MPNKTAQKCYTLAVTDGKKAELTMYGEIVEARPVDWWTGEPVEGEFIILSEFLRDLDTIKDAEELTIHLNSVGGDAFCAISIHNRLRELKAKKTCVVDGVAMSGGSHIMCACDRVLVNPSSIVMIHNGSVFLWDRMNAVDMRKLASQLDVVDNSQAEIYARKTGKSMEDLRAMMDATTYLSGRQAVEEGFADELMEDAKDPEIAVSADHRTLYACGHRLPIAACGSLPDGIKTIETAPTSGEDKSKPDASGKNEGGTPMTLEELKANDPEAYAAMLAEAQATAGASAVEAERQRIADIDAVAALYDDATVQAAKYGEKACTAQEMTYRAAVEAAKQGKKFVADAQADYQESGAGNVSAASAHDEESAPDTAEQRRAAGKSMAAKLSGKKEEA